MLSPGVPGLYRAIPAFSAKDERRMNERKMCEGCRLQYIRFYNQARELGKEVSLDLVTTQDTRLAANQF
jgi:hypothetical protein